jgi:hypothetical protein
VKKPNIRIAIGAAFAASLTLSSVISLAQSAPAAGGGAKSPGPMAAPAAVPGLTNPVPALPIATPGSVGAAVPPMAGTSTPAQTLPGNQPLNPPAGTGSHVPMRSDTAVMAFRSLDPANRGFVTRAETDRIQGFNGFDYADTNRDGRLDAEEFAVAWKFYGAQ